MAPVAMIAPWPGIRRGTDPSVPTVPGLVSEIVVPSKSCTVSLLLRARDTMSSNAFHDTARSSATPASLMFGTLSERAPSLPATSTAMPMLTWSRTARNGWPLVLGVGVIQAGIGSESPSRWPSR